MGSNIKEQADLNLNNNGVVLMVDPEDDSTLSLKDLLYSVLRNLGIVLIVAVILAGALFAYKITRTTDSFNALDTSVQSDGESDFEYQTRINKINRARDIAAAIDKVNLQIEHQRSYLTDSVYMQIDPENVYESRTQFVIALDGTAAEGADKALVAAYQNAVYGGTFLDEYAENNGFKADYIKEVISIDSTVADSSVLSGNENAIRVASITVKTIGPSECFVKDVTELIKNHITAESSKLNKTVASHKITLGGVQENSKADSGIRDNQTNQTAKLENLQKQVTGFNDSLEQIAKDLGLSGKEDLINYFEAEREAELTDAPMPDNAEPVSFMSVIKPGIKYGLIGFVAGFCVVTVIFVLAYVFGKKITTQAQFFGKFKNIRKIGVLKPLEKRCGFTVKIDIKSEDDSKMSADNMAKLVANNYGNLTKDLGKVLITGTGDKKAISEAVKKLGIKGDVKIDMFSDPDVLKAVPDYDGVVLIEQRKVSLFKNVANEIALIENAGTKIIGAIII